MTEERLREIDERAKRATPGQWAYDSYNTVLVDAEKIIASILDHPADGNWGDPSTRPLEVNQERGKWYAESANNAEFIAHSRADIPDLIAEVRELRAKIAGQEREWRVVYESHRPISGTWKSDGDDFGVHELKARQHAGCLVSSPNDFRNIRIESRTKAGAWEPLAP